MDNQLLNLYASSSLARDALLPQIEVDAGEGVAVDARVKEGIRDVEDGALHCAHVVRSLADNLGMRRISAVGLPMEQPNLTNPTQCLHE